MTRTPKGTLAKSICIAGLVLACVGPTSKPQPLSSSSEAAETQFVMEESYWATMDGVVVHLPYGVYRADLEDARGVYYRAPYPIKRKPLLFGSERLVDGGVFVPKSSSQKWLGILWVYLLREDGSIETHQLPGEIHSGEGSLWRIEAVGKSPGYQVRVACIQGAPDGAYALLLPDGTTQVTGFLARGNRDGVFTFYRSTGEKVAEVPYVMDRVSGTVKLWYGPEYGVERRKLVSQYLDGYPNGNTEGWYPDGSLVERSVYAEGRLQSTEIRDERNRRISDSEARKHVEAARESDRKYFDILEEVVADNLPSCMPGS